MSARNNMNAKRAWHKRSMPTIPQLNSAKPRFCGEENIFGKPAWAVLHCRVCRVGS